MSKLLRLVSSSSSSSLLRILPPTQRQGRQRQQHGCCTIFSRVVAAACRSAASDASGSFHRVGGCAADKKRLVYRQLGVSTNSPTRGIVLQSTKFLDRIHSYRSFSIQSVNDKTTITTTTTTTSTATGNEMSSNGNLAPTTTTSPPAPAPKKRRRSEFAARHHQNLQHIPSFHEFQQRQTVKSLYRQYLRLIVPLERQQLQQQEENNHHHGPDTNTTSRGTRQRHEMRLQIRTEFQRGSILTDAWDIKRAISEATRRYKELSSMLLIGTTTTSTTADSQSSSRRRDPTAGMDPNERDEEQSTAATTTKPAWPWQKQPDTRNRPAPKPIPRKTLS